MKSCLLEEVNIKKKGCIKRFYQGIKPRNIIFTESQSRQKGKTILKKNYSFHKELNNQNHKIGRAGAQLKGINILNQMKVYIKNILMRMSYKQKLENILNVIQEADELCCKYGFFFVTPAMIFFNPKNKIKLSIWIHPNMKQIERMHPIREETFEQRQFICMQSLNNIIKQLFPTISLGNQASFKGLYKKLIYLEYRRKMKLHQFHQEQRNIQREKLQKKVLFQNQVISKELLSVIQEINQPSYQILSVSKSSLSKSKTLETEKNCKSNSSNTMSQLKDQKYSVDSLSQINLIEIRLFSEQSSYFLENDLTKSEHS